MRVISLKLPEDLVERIDTKAGHRGRSRFIREAVEAALGITPTPSRNTSIPVWVGSTSERCRRAFMGHRVGARFYCVKCRAVVDGDHFK